jgi:hypothetical protein
MPSMLEWRLVGGGLDNPQVLAHDGQGGLLAINKVVSTMRPDEWWLTGPKCGLWDGPQLAGRSEGRSTTLGRHWPPPGSGCVGL